MSHALCCCNFAFASLVWCLQSCRATSRVHRHRAVVWNVLTFHPTPSTPVLVPARSFPARAIWMVLGGLPTNHPSNARKQMGVSEVKSPRAIASFSSLLVFPPKPPRANALCGKGVHGSTEVANGSKNYFSFFKCNPSIKLRRLQNLLADCLPRTQEKSRNNEKIAYNRDGKSPPDSTRRDSLTVAPTVADKEKIAPVLWRRLVCTLAERRWAWRGSELDILWFVSGSPSPF